MKASIKTKFKTIVRRCVSKLVLGATFAGLSFTVFAHGGHDPRVKIAMTDREIRFETSVRADYFMRYDTNRDGVLSKQEFLSLHTAVLNWLDNKITLMDSDGLRLKPYFSDAPIVGGDMLEDGDAIKYVKIIRRYKIQDSADALQLNLDIFENSHHSPYIYLSQAGKMSALKNFAVCLPMEQTVARERNCHISTIRLVNK